MSEPADAVVGGTVGVVGLGLMGQALATRLLAAGTRTAGYDIDPAKRSRLAANGGQACESLAALFDVATDVVLCVFNAAQARDVAQALPQRAPGEGGESARRLTVVCTSTCDPADMAALGREVESRGHDFIEMPISGSSRQFADGQAVGLVACREAVNERRGDLMRAICRQHPYLGPVFGDASRAKLAINLVLGVNRAALAEGLAFAGALGLDPARFLEVLKGSAAYSQVMDVKGPLMLHRRFEPPQSRVDQSHKDFSLIVGLGEQVGLGLPFARRYRALMAECIDRGEAHLDNAIIIGAIERQIPPTEKEAQ
ncbi:2-hydroxy-3-oxopropionate reductase [Variovorax sp. PBL-H6]|uniref:NAD(P)-dependent oxidoreductase n=1 Tax=Variovorax sp. PBL-H6 TaxID=434009 RepID=UPI001318FA1C|nr:NAD(P)-dependent oxidoreductase [Variovorax sp. PBL-H6]VTU16205.1 2-hydroxy-3-oxopropionate reductase [Variovorax sp. PBL-H6]